MHAGRSDGSDHRAAIGKDDRPTRLCDLPWQNFVVDTTTDTPLAAPCRNHPYEWNARDLEHTASELGSLRRNLLRGDLNPVCRSCPDKALASTSELRTLIEAENLDDTNQLVEAMRDVVGSPPLAPSSDLTYRVAHTRDSQDFLLTGLVTMFDFMPFISKYDTSEHRRLLDWGCGSGRLAIHLTNRHPEIDLTGCDIDAEAVKWCRDNIPSGDFSVIDPLPPTQFARGQFTSIIAYSVVTHLDRQHQAAWIDELYDLLADNGVLILTTMGETAARANGLDKQLKTAGIVDSRLDATLDALAPVGYYRSTFQSRGFTERLWGRRFNIVEYIDAGIFNYQDLIVLTKKKEGTGVGRTPWWRRLIRGS